MLLQDNSLSTTLTLPQSSQVTTSTTVLDLGEVTPRASLDITRAEFFVTLPVLTATQLPGIETLNIAVLSSVYSNGSSANTEISQLTPAIPASYSGTTVYFKLRFGVSRYLLLASQAASTGALAQTASAQLGMVF